MTVEKSKPTSFVVGKPRIRVDPEKLEEFASQASLTTQKPTQSVIKVAATTSADRNRTFLLKLLPEQFDRIEEVLAQSTFKSKQQMGETMLMSAVEDLAKKLGI